MSEDRKQEGKKALFVGNGYHPITKGYQPTESLKTSEPPQSGSGVPSKSEKTNKKD